MHQLIKRFLNDYHNISRYYRYLVDKTKQHENVGITSEWLIDNYYLVVEYKKMIEKDKKSISKMLHNSKMLYPLLQDIVIHNEYNINYKLLVKEVNSYQRKNDIYFTYEEFSLLPVLLYFIYTKKLDHILESVCHDLEVEEVVKHKIESFHDSNYSFSSILGDEKLLQDDTYIFEMNRQLRETGKESNYFFKELTKLLEEHKKSLKDIVRDKYQEKMHDTMLISNIFTDIKDILIYDIETNYSKMNQCEKILMEDSIYNKMTSETKECYRKKITKLAKKRHMNEYDFAKELLEEAKEKDCHIGYLLFQNTSIRLKTVSYITSIFVLSILLAWMLSYFFITPKFLGFVILLIPSIQLITQLVHQILMSFIKPKPLFKMNYLKGLPEESSCMVVIPTIISDTRKIKDVFDRLETYYLMNKSNHLYFTLLADAKKEEEEVMPYDREIIDFGVEYLRRLNKKYKKDLFHFVYRKRVWSEDEDAFLGYERKRGALLHFNRLLLKKTTPSFEKQYFNVHTLSEFDVKIKYVISLDTDTEPVLNSLLKLIGCMAHPLNKPVLNQEKNKVISGYGMIQPKVSTDIEATNTSLFSQIFAGIGGFDTYSALAPNVYQDVFSEGNFVGKGIYDLEIFDQVLYERFPEHLILSHDLLEGSYLRCGYASDIEIVDGFPSKFLVEASRNHRWARGDSQIISYLGAKVKNKNKELETNPLNLLEKYKILDNIIRMFVYPSLLFILVLTIFKEKYQLLFLLFTLLVVAFPILSFLRSKLYVKKELTTTVYYKDLLYGGKALLLRTATVFSTIPYYTNLYMDAFVRAIYRMFYSHKNLLSWTSSEDASKTISSSFLNYVREFSYQIIFSIILLIVAIFMQNIIGIVVATIFFMAPLLTYYISLDLDDDSNQEKLDEKEEEEFLSIANKTWNYFSSFLKEEYNYLIPDNYQETREEKLEYRTSPTNIGYSLTSVISAYFLGLIDIDKCMDYLEKIVMTIDSLEKWNGHLYNWYHIKTKKALPPRFISSVDSGNLVASLIVTLEFLRENEQDDLVMIVESLIEETNFKKLYTKKDVLSIGFDIEKNQLSIYNYNKFASESRLTSFIAICKGDIPTKHWFCLDKTLTTYKKYKGLVSWSGTAFEYYMPLLFMKNYKNTLLDETYQFAHICQKSYVESIDRKLPYGISESAYSELDQGLNYKYRGFSVPYLTSKEETIEKVVISPYSSLLEAELYPKDVLRNIEKLKKLNMVFQYGFYDAYDYSSKKVVRVCYSHHQGMILMGLTNYLKNNIVKEYFHSNVKIKAFETLLKEKVQVRANIDMKMESYKKYNYEKEKLENDIRSFDYISDMPEVSILSNKKYMLLVNDRGSGFSRYRTLQLNRYRKITEQDYGMFLYIKDMDTKKVWSNTYAPMNQKPDKYEVVFASDKIKFFRKDGMVSTKTEIIVLEDEQAEIRKITFYNDSEEFKRLELTSYTEPILSENAADVSHKVYNQMFLEIEWDNDLKALVVKRKGKEKEAPSYMLNALMIDHPIDSYSYETNRFQLVGRGHDYHNPMALDKKLTNHVGSNIEPILSIRNQIEVSPHSKNCVYLVCGYGRSRKQLESILSLYHDKKHIDRAFKISNLASIATTKRLNITGSDMRLYNMMLNYIYQTTKISISQNRQQLLSKNALQKNSLWKFGISGDYPMIVVNIKDLTNLTFVMEILKAFEYFKNKSIFMDVIIINSEIEEYAETIKKEIDNELYRIYSLNSFYHTPGTVYVLEQNDISKEEMILLQVVARLYFDVEKEDSLKDEILKLEENNRINDYKKVETLHNIRNENTYSLEYDNSYGGFQKEGREYFIYQPNTPTPWSNIIANEKFGTIVTNNGCGYTFFENSLEFKLTSWTNEMVINDKSEGIKINGKIFEPTSCTHGFGYSILEGEQEGFKTTLTEFIPTGEAVKIYLIEIENIENEAKEMDLSFYINPTLGNFEEKTSRHILSEMMNHNQYMRLRNVYNIDYSDVSVFLSSSETIKDYVIDRILVKEIKTTIVLEKKKKKQIVFMMGCSRNDLEIDAYISKYRDLKNVKKELRNVSLYWKKKLSTIHVETKEKSFDYMMNGWYLYQAISSRIFARAGFYQVSGAYGYRDQLQDAMNLCLVDSLLTKKQILINASHQFKKGDVLHWWHEKNHFGLRSRYKDDYLWLVYAVIHYIEITNDITILEEEVPYIEGEELTAHEVDKGMIFTYSEEKETLFEHLILSLEYSMKQLGEHGLPLMGGGDWNDGMNKVGIKGKGESVWLGFFLYLITDKIMPIIAKYKEDFDISIYKEFNKELKTNLNTYGYENGYYLRAYFDNGDKLGSITSSECKIDLISQSFAILSGVGEEKTEDLIRIVEKELVDSKSNIVKLLSPPFKESLNDPGYIMNYPKGIRENGGQYTHAVAWYIMALIKAKKYDLAYHHFQMINPVNRTLNKKGVETYQVEPYVIAADIYSNPAFLARGGWTWYTGSAGWFYKVGMEDILGIEKRGDILKIEPHLSSSNLNYSVEYQYKDAIYHIQVKAAKKRRITIDGKTSKNDFIELKEKGSYQVIVYRNGEEND